MKSREMAAKAAFLPARWRQSTPFAETSITVPGARIYL
jgi:hypothetical protein